MAIDENQGIKSETQGVEGKSELAEKVGPGHPPKENWWKKGQPSANPKGRPKNPWPAFLKEAVLDSNGDDTGMTRGRVLMIKIFGDAAGINRCKDPTRSQELIMNYWLGKPVTPVELSGPNQRPISVLEGKLDFLDIEQMEKLNSVIAATNPEESDE